MLLTTSLLVVLGYSLSWLLGPSMQTKPFQVTAHLAIAGITEDDFNALEEDEGDVTELSPKLIHYILDDRAKRISDSLNIPEDLRKRVEFWFKIYAMYTISNAVLHDTDHPWVLYEVINLNSVYSNYRKAQDRKTAKSNMIRNARYKYIHVLDKLSKAKHFRNLTSDEKKVYALFKEVPGDRKLVFSKAKGRVRVQLGQKDSVVYGIKRSGRYLKSMEKIFQDQQLPIELTRIPFLESSFNLNAYSKDGASGIWQFMYKTGKIFLNVSSAQGIDERNHPLKATRAAAKLLHQNYQILKNWPLAVTAYNHGPGGLLQGMRKIKSQNLNDLIENYKHPYFGFASQNFYSCFLAILHVEQYQDEIFGYLEKDKHLDHEDIEIMYSMRVKFIKEICTVSQEDIKLYNPDLRKKALSSYAYLPEGYYLKLPNGKKQCLLNFYQEVENTNRILDKILGKDSK